MAQKGSKKFFYQVILIFVVMLIVFIVQQYYFAPKKILIDPSLSGQLNDPYYLLPGEKSDYQEIRRLRYTLSYNEEAEQANWVAYQLTADDVIMGRAKRLDDFREDPKVKTGSAGLEDYKGSGYDRGHLAPAADMKRSKKTMSQSFFMSNMSPQTPGFNRGIWRQLEEKVRVWAEKDELLYIVTGPVLKDGLPTIGPNQVAVPEYYYKVIIDVSLPEGKGIGFVMKNEGSDKRLRNFAVTIDSVERLTGFDFFHQLPDSLENDLEGLVYPRLWGL